MIENLGNPLFWSFYFVRPYCVHSHFVENPCYLFFFHLPFGFDRKVLDILQNSPHTRVSYFYTICAVILDVVCGLNYVPFQGNSAMLGEMVQKLDRTARETGNHIYIYGQGQNEEEQKKNRESVYKSVKFFYIKPKGGQSAAAKQMKESCDKILTEYTVHVITTE